MLKEKVGPNYNTPSYGKFKWFKHRYTLHNVKASGEPASADVKAVEQSLQALHMLIVKENYLPKQIFNMDETW